ncbi:hypothetical protein D6774_04440 [Candidatus Woesearchaeota archaeon]|nr:MAG: hypothetical protein D6774_04440 [Candidatus Woesearchaeota archaeon]
MEQYETADGSLTYINEEVGEYYHSKTGAREEAFEKYAKPTMIDRFNKVKILDVCFGLGYNSAAALDQFKGEHISIVGLEADPRIIEEIGNIKAPFLSWEYIQEVARFGSYEDNERLIELIIGDAREEVKNLIKKGETFDVVFFDPFSPKKAPHMWTQEFFSDIRKVMKPTAILATYSCASQVRANLRAAGFKVRDGPSVGRRGPSTLAFA